MGHPGLCIIGKETEWLLFVDGEPLEGCRGFVKSGEYDNGLVTIVMLTDGRNWEGMLPVKSVNALVVSYVRDGSHEVYDLSPLTDCRWSIPACGYDEKATIVLRAKCGGVRKRPEGGYWWWEGYAPDDDSLDALRVRHQTRRGG